MEIQYKCEWQRFDENGNAVDHEEEFSIKLSPRHANRDNKCTPLKDAYDYCYNLTDKHFFKLYELTKRGKWVKVATLHSDWRNL